MEKQISMTVKQADPYEEQFVKLNDSIISDEISRIFFACGTTASIPIN